MAASLSQMIANRLNALKSSGPKTEDGKRRASQNARTLGLSKVQVVPPQEMAEAIDERKQLWENDYRPEGPTQHWIFGRLVAESVRLDSCEARLLASRADRADRASESWDDDRAAEVALRASRLADRPDAIQPTLLQSKHGVRWLLERWDEVADCLAKREGFTHANWHQTLDLLGVPLTSRDQTGPWDLGDATSTAPGFALIADASSSLRDRLDEFLTDRDARHRHLAESGLDGDDPATIRLLERYAADARRQIFRHTNSLRSLQAGRSPSSSVSPVAAAAVSSAPAVSSPPAPSASAPEGPPGPRPVRVRPPRPASVPSPACSAPNSSPSSSSTPHSPSTPGGASFPSPTPARSPETSELVSALINPSAPNSPISPATLIIPSPSSSPIRESIAAGSSPIESASLSSPIRESIAVSVGSSPMAAAEDADPGAPSFPSPRAEERGSSSPIRESVAAEVSASPSPSPSPVGLADRRSSVTDPSSTALPGSTNPGRSMAAIVRSRLDSRPPTPGNRRSRRAAARAASARRS